LREILRNDANEFPVAALEREMALRGKSLEFGAAEIDDLLEIEYGDRRTFPLLSLLYPFVDTRQLHHVDHIFPKGLLQPRKLAVAGCDRAMIEACVGNRDRLPNLQLLGGTLNTVKSDQEPKAWFEATYRDPSSLREALDRNDLGELPDGAADFVRFYEARKERLRARLAQLLGAKSAAASPLEEAAAE